MRLEVEEGLVWEELRGRAYLDRWKGDCRPRTFECVHFHWMIWQ